MTGYLDITRAARASGVSRREIQKRIADGDLTSFEGRIEQSALARLYPRAAAPAAGMIEHLAELKEAALHKPPQDIAPEDEASLAEAYSRACSELARARALARDRLLLLKDMERLLGQLEVDVNPPQRVRALSQWLKVRLRRDEVR